MPWLELLTAELSEKLESEIRFSVRDLWGSDMVGRAQTLKLLKEALPSLGTDRLLQFRRHRGVRPAWALSRNPTAWPSSGRRGTCCTTTGSSSGGGGPRWRTGRKRGPNASAGAGLRLPERRGTTAARGAPGRNGQRPPAEVSALNMGDVSMSYRTRAMDGTMQA